MLSDIINRTTYFLCGVIVAVAFFSTKSTATYYNNMAPMDDGCITRLLCAFV